MLKKGDTIGIISLAGACEKEKINKAKLNLEALGYKVILSQNIYDENNYLAGSDEDKIHELHSFFKNPEIKLILNARGGYGSIRLINKIDYDIIKNNPKIFCGFSDITALLLMFYKKCGLKTFHGPMACSDFGVDNINKFTYEHFIKTINNEPLEFQGNSIQDFGSVKGILWGGNLATVTSLCGQDFIPDEDFIFFTEDLNEPVYKIDKMFTQLFNIEQFKKYCKAIVLGDFLNIDNDIWLDDFVKTLPVTTIKGFKITHACEKITIPIGKLAEIIENKLLIY